MTLKHVNFDAVSGIHYGLLPHKAVSPVVIEEIQALGTDVTFENAVTQAKDSLFELFDKVDETEYSLRTEETIGVLVAAYVGDWMDEDRQDKLIIDFLDEYFQTSEELWDGLEADVAAYLLLDKDVVPTIGYTEDDYVIESDGTDLFIIKAPFYTLCAECTDTAPNAGHLTTQGEMKTYCLGPEWFEDDKAPYTVFSVGTKVALAA